MTENCVELFLIYRKMTQEDDFETFVEHMHAKAWMDMHKAHTMSLLHKDPKHPDVIAIIGEELNIPVVDDPFADQEPVPEILDVDGEKIEVVNEYHAYCSACRFHIYNSCDPSDAAASFVEHVNSSKHIGCMLLLGEEELCEGLFTVEIPSRGIWLCNACNEQVTKMYREETQSLKQCIEEHIGSTSHKESIALFKNESRALLLTLATTPTLKHLIQFSRYHKTAYCKLCKTEFEKTDVFPHISSSHHLNNLYTHVRETNPEHQALWTQLQKIAKDYETIPGRLFSTHFEKSPDDTKIDYYVKQILSKSWATYNPHPDTVRNEHPTELTGKYNDRHVKVINNTHAVCLICRYHIVGRVMKNDWATVCFKHLSTPGHMLWEEDFPNDRRMLFRGPYCDACGFQYDHRFFKKPERLEEAIERHLDFKDHLKNEKLWESNSGSVLVGLSYTPWFRDFLYGWECRLCRRNFYQYSDILHCRSIEHLRNLEKFLEKETGLRVTDAVDEDTIYQIVEYFLNSEK